MRSLPAALALALSACGPPRTGPGEGGAVEGVWWVLESYTPFNTVERPNLPQGVVQWMTFSGGQYTSGGATNRFGGAAPVTDVKIRFLVEWSTFAAQDQFERDYQSNLTGTRTFTATGDQLLLFDSANYQITVFRASATDPTQM
ncbi:MAG TPA: META domain-containing protein [Myxococcaceae bacterium]|nr:META domain-containing protein [Myxococcaceae bacterium]